MAKRRKIAGYIQRSGAQRNNFMAAEADIHRRSVNFTIFTRPNLERCEIAITSGHVADERISIIGICLRRAKEYFNKTGKIVSMRFWSNSFDFIRGTVQFQHVKQAKNALKCLGLLNGNNAYLGHGQIFIFAPERPSPDSPSDGHFYIERRFADTELSTQQNGDGLNILDLDDDCIQKIFDCLNVMDLCSVADICQRFKGIAQKGFAVRHKTLHFLDVVMLDEDQMAKFAEIFGPVIEKLELTPQVLPDVSDFSDWLNRHFTGLKEFTLHHVIIDDAFVVQFRPILVRLTKLSICEGRVSKALSDMLIHCNELKNLEITQSYMNGVFLPLVHLPKLESLSIIGKFTFELRDLEKFIECNSHLKRSYSKGNGLFLHKLQPLF